MNRIPGMGAIPHNAGVAFRVWAPHAERVHVLGSFNDWSSDQSPLQSEGNGYWYGNVECAKVGDEYRFEIKNGDKILRRIDPYAREVTNSIGNGIIHNSDFDWGEDRFQMPTWNELVVYEMHLGTFHRPADQPSGTFEDATEKFDHLRRLGINAIELMPTGEFAGDISWGYNPAHIFAVESAYGGPRALKEFVREAHRQGFAVILDVVYNHFGPSDLDLWQFDGWSENNKGGIYFYNDWRAATPWGDTRPDYGRGEVRQFLHDNAMMWLDEFRLDGLRYDMTLFIRSVDGSKELPEGWSLAQWINKDLQAKFPHKILIAEDLQNNPYLTKSQNEGGAGFNSQWDAAFVHPVRKVIRQTRDEDRDMNLVRDAICHRYNIDSFGRVIYSESHDEVANGKTRVPSEINPGDPTDLYAQKRSCLAAGLVCTSPGIPMLFQGQEFLQGDWFDDTVPLDWSQREEFRGIVRLYSDLIALRRNLCKTTRGLTGQHVRVHHIHHTHKLLAFHRWESGGPGDDVIVVANFANKQWSDYRIGLPAEGRWRLRLNTDWKGYSREFNGVPSGDMEAQKEADNYDGFPASGAIAIAPYSMLVYSQDPS